MKLIAKIWRSYKVIKDNFPELKKEYQDLNGITKQVIGEIIHIWN